MVNYSIKIHMSMEEFLAGVDRLYAGLKDSQPIDIEKPESEKSISYCYPIEWPSSLPPPPSPVTMDTPEGEEESPEVNSVCYMCEKALFANPSITFRFCLDCDARLVEINKAKQKQQKDEQRIVEEFAGCSVG